MFGKSLTPDFQCLEKPKLSITMLGKAKLKNSNVWKSLNTDFRCLEQPYKSLIVELFPFF